LRVIPVREDGTLDLDQAGRLIGARTRLVAVAHVSNVLGTVNPVRTLAELAHAAGALILVDAAQSAVHLPVDVQALGADFLVTSGHKMLGPTGSGFLYARADLLEAMPPWQTGGGMISRVGWNTTTFAPIPQRFEAGTPAIAEVIALGAAMDYLAGIGFEAITRHEGDLLAYAHQRLGEVAGLRIFGTAQEKTGVVSFALEGCHPHDVGTILDREGVAIRAGHHCAQPLMERFGVPAMARASFCLYNTRQDVDALVQGLARVRKVMG
jgi:cysteine desulfurase/selenocysteine lyase